MKTETNPSTSMKTAFFTGFSSGCLGLFIGALAGTAFQLLIGVKAEGVLACFGLLLILGIGYGVFQIVKNFLITRGFPAPSVIGIIVGIATPFVLAVILSSVLILVAPQLPALTAISTPILPTTTLIPPTQTFARPTVTPAPPPTCLKEAPSGLMIFSLSGSFEPTEPPPMEESLNPEAWNTARRLVCDDSFFIRHEQGDYNTWAALLEVEKSITAGEIPHKLAEGDKTVGTIIEEYGEPSFVGKFRLESGEILNVYWFGPIFIMADGLDSTYNGIGGWLSLLTK